MHVSKCRTGADLTLPLFYSIVLLYSIVHSWLILKKLTMEVVG